MPLHTITEGIAGPDHLLHHDAACGRAGERER